MKYLKLEDRQLRTVVDALRTMRATRMLHPDDLQHLDDVIEHVAYGRHVLPAEELRRLEADQALAGWDFGGEVVDVGGWEIDGDTWSCSVFVASAHVGSSTRRLRLTVKFQASVVEVGDPADDAGSPPAGTP